jgi:hypothetical protein
LYTPRSEPQSGWHRKRKEGNSKGLFNPALILSVIQITVTNALPS